MLEINNADAVAEVTAAFERYEAALNGDDIAALNEMFWQSELTLRYGVGEESMGHAAIAAFRNARGPTGQSRTLRNTVITTFGRDFATTNTESHQENSNRIGRQSQTWARMPEGWRIVCAHVSRRTPAG